MKPEKIVLTFCVMISVCVWMSGCHMEIPGAPVAEFEAKQEGAGLVTFNNKSVNGTSFLWDYGDGTTENISNNLSSHKYNTSGTYVVKLIAKGDGGSAGKAQNVTVDISSAAKAPEANFTYQSTNGQAAPSVVTLTSTSTGNISAYQWRVGGTSISTQKDATFTFQNAGTFKVSLSVTGPGGSNTKEIDIEIKGSSTANPIASFTVGTSSGTAKFSSVFNNTSQNASTFLWNFDDGTTSTEKSPTHEFAMPGIFNVILVATGANGATNAVAGEVVVLAPARITEFYTGNTIASSTTFYTYTDADKLVSSKDASNGNNEFENTNTYAYEGNRVVKRTFRQLLKGATGVQGTVDYQYNQLGQLVKAINNFVRPGNGYQTGDRGTTTYEYGPNLMVSKITADSIIYNYSGNGVLTSISFIGMGSAQRSRIDGVDYVGAPVVTNGRISGYNFTNGASRSITYDSKGQRVSDVFTDPGRHKKITQTWTYDDQTSPESMEAKFKGHPRYIQGYVYNNVKAYNFSSGSSTENITYTIDYNAKGLPNSIKRDKNDFNEMKSYKYLLR